MSWAPPTFPSRSFEGETPFIVITKVDSFENTAYTSTCSVSFSRKLVKLMPGLEAFSICWWKLRSERFIQRNLHTGIFQDVPLSY